MVIISMIFVIRSWANYSTLRCVWVYKGHRALIRHSQHRTSPKRILKTATRIWCQFWVLWRSTAATSTQGRCSCKPLRRSPPVKSRHVHRTDLILMSGKPSTQFCAKSVIPTILIPIHTVTCRSQTAFWKRMSLIWPAPQKLIWEPFGRTWLYWPYHPFSHNCRHLL